MTDILLPEPTVHAGRHPEGLRFLFGHDNADLVSSHPTLVKLCTKECAEYASQKHLLLHDVHIQGETADEQQACLSGSGHVSVQTHAVSSPSGQVQGAQQHPTCVSSGAAILL